MNQSLIAWLTSTGLDDKRASIYLTVLSCGESTATELAKKLNITRTTIYDNLRILEDRGYVRVVRRGKRSVYLALNPKELLGRVDAQRERLNELLPDFLSLTTAHSSAFFSQTYSGPYASREIFEDILKHAKGEYAYFSAPGETIRTIDRRFMEAWIARRVAKKIKSRSLRVKTNTAPAKAIFTAESPYLRQIRFLPAYVNLSCSVYIYGNRIGVISTKKEGMSYIIHSPDLAFTFMQLFEFLWGISLKSS